MPLRGRSFRITGDQPSLQFAGALLRLLGAEVEQLAGPGLSVTTLAGEVLVVEAEPAPAAYWASSGAMALTGDPDGPPLAGPPDVPARMKAAALVARLLARSHPHLGRDLELDGPRLFGERAALAGLQRQGQTSVGGASRLLAAADGWVAVSLARTTDFEVLPAWLGHGVDRRDPWAAVVGWLRSRPVDDAVDRGQLLGLPVAAARVPGEAGETGETGETGGARMTGPWAITSHPTGARVDRPPVVIDLSSLWAGPLCGSLLAQAGARVIKVESCHRPDGARRGTPAFFDLLNAGKEAVALDLDSESGRHQLRMLITAADVVIESARPRVMQQWGIDVERIVAERGQLVWVSITGYGRRGARFNWVAFGDDAAAAGGLLAIGADGAPRFCADAAADPATGLHAAVATLAALAGGGSHLIDVPLTNVAAFLVGPARVASAVDTSHPIATPTARTPRGTGPSLGQDTERVLRELAGRSGAER